MAANVFETFTAYTGLSMQVIGIICVPAFVMTILGLVASANQPAQRITPSAPKKKKKRSSALRGKHEFVHRPSLLDTGMSIVVPWKHDGPQSNPMKRSVFRGWFTLCWLIALSYMIQYFMNNIKARGSLIRNMDWFRSLYYSLHELLIVLLPVYALSFTAFFLEKLMSLEVFGKSYTRQILHGFQHCFQTIMIFGMIFDDEFC